MSEERPVPRTPEEEETELRVMKIFYKRQSKGLPPTDVPCLGTLTLYFAGLSHWVGRECGAMQFMKRYYTLCFVTSEIELPVGGTFRQVKQIPDAVEADGKLKLREAMTCSWSVSSEQYQFYVELQFGKLERESYAGRTAVRQYDYRVLFGNRYGDGFEVRTKNFNAFCEFLLGISKKPDDECICDVDTCKGKYA